VRTELESEGIIHREDGLRGSITYRHYRAPWRALELEQGSDPCLARRDPSTARVFVRGRPFVNIAFDDPRFSRLDLRVDGASMTIEVDDASVFNDRASGQITTRVRCADPAAALTTIRAQHTRRGAHS